MGAALNAIGMFHGLNNVYARLKSLVHLVIAENSLQKKLK